MAMISRRHAGTRLAARAAVIAGAVALAGVALAAPAGAAGTSTSAGDENWLVAAHQTNLSEMAAGRDASRYAQDRSVRGFAEDLVTDHAERDRKIVELASKYDVFLPKTPTTAQAQALAALQGREGEAYDTAWVRARIASHRQAQTVNQREIDSGEASDVRTAARDARETEQDHLESLSDLAVDLGIAGPPAEVTGGTGGQAAAMLSAERRLPATILAAIGLALIGTELVLARRRRRAAR
jgi:putative membrane protein